MLTSPITVVLKNGKEVTLKSPLPVNASAVLTFVRQLFHESSENLNGPPAQFDLISQKQEAEFLESLIGAPKDFMICAFYKKAVVGNLNLQQIATPVSEHCGQFGIGVLNSFQNIGLGAALLKQCIVEANRHGIWNLRMTVRTFNKPAIALYEKLGFRRVGTLHAVAKIGEKYLDEYLYQRIEEGRS
ncbi:MAG: GNAT family N-acetyltransferase [Deltaproteobacteria bacterium]|nr:GNAT family N-acetyltransferase [Deltaproteobacteria bacterium]